jgi:Bacteriophage KPP10, Structural protein ORF10
MQQTFDPKKVKVIVLQNPIIGFADGTFAKVERNTPTWSLKVGADGETCRSRSHDKSGRLTLTLMGSSPSNDALAAAAQQDELDGTGIGPVLIQDLSGTTLCAAANAWVTQPAGVEFGKEVSDREWVIEMDSVEMFPGGIPLVAT